MKPLPKNQDVRLLRVVGTDEADLAQDRDTCPDGGDMKRNKSV